MNLANQFETVTNWYLSLGGVLVSDEHYQARLEVCKACPKAGTVNLPLGAKTPGCTECGCPFATKPRVDHYAHPIQGRKKVTCPLNKWEIIDQNFN